MGHLVIENRHGLIVDATASTASPDRSSYAFSESRLGLLIRLEGEIAQPILPARVAGITSLTGSRGSPMGPFGSRTLIETSC